MDTLYVVPNWERDFENARSAEVENAKWFLCPNHFDGKKISRLQGLKRPAELYGTFHAILAIASKCPYRGVLLDHDGPINAQDLAAKTRFPADCFVYALTELVKPSIQLLEKFEIEKKDGIWQLPETVKAWAVHSSQRRRRRDAAGGRPPTSAHAGAPPPTSAHVRHENSSSENGTVKAGSLVSEDSARPRPPTSAHAGAPPPASAHVSPREPTGADRVVEGKGREGNRREMPPAVPQGGDNGQSQMVENAEPPPPTAQFAIEEARRNVGLVEARSLICEKILGGRDPNRMWSPEAENRLALMVEAGLPRQEIEDIAWFRGLPANDEIPELRKRQFPITVTTLMNYWADEADRSRDFRKKNAGSGMNGSTQKKEPAGWRDFFRAQFPDVEDLRLPASFHELPADLRVRWERGHEEWEQAENRRGAAA